MRPINLITLVAVTIWLNVFAIPTHLNSMSNPLPVDRKLGKPDQTSTAVPSWQILESVWGDNNEIAVVYLGQTQFRVKILDSAGHILNTFDIDNAGFIDRQFVWGVKPTSNLLAAASVRVYIFDSKTGAKSRVLDNGLGPDSYMGVSWANDGRIAAAQETMIDIWNAQTGELLNSFGIGTDQDRATSVAWRPNHPDEIAGNFESSGVGIWNVKTGALLRKLPVTLATDSSGNLLDGVGDVAWSPDGNWLATRTLHNVILWNAPSWSMRVIRYDTGKLVWSPDSKYLLGLFGNAVLSIDPATGKVSTPISINNPDFAIDDISFSPDGKHFVYVGSSNSNPGASGARPDVLVVADTNPTAHVPINLMGLCSASPESHRIWRVHNTNTYDVLFTWQIPGTDQSGWGVARPGADYVFQAPTAANSSNNIQVFVNSTQEATQTGNAATCAANEREQAPTDSSAP